MSRLPLENLEGMQQNVPGRTGKCGTASRGMVRDIVRAQGVM